ncbi:hypothetical protein A5819_003613 [Enterococcus sp. 7E2_DIV0204]|uniref:hypothetical protein n=1 Tax=unclassified Enterococcus TaxID=2608891 RepID=UPI000A349ADA|nr:MULTISPECIES: hypothetical protein [unclassified Enterococcus]OTN84063.1 hypothetical protein A5819_003613 [Enterococcus sp. 7E2_DIV0204]OTP47249.1 hypothetical protein A5884_003624 [Enterococcus sp. 7D2_DIV0200]
MSNPGVLFYLFFGVVILFIIGEIWKFRKERELMERKAARYNQEQLLKLLKQQELIIEQGSKADMEKLMDLNQFMERICITLVPPEDRKEKIRIKVFQEKYGTSALFKSTKQNFSKSLTQQSKESVQELIIAIANKEETKTNPELVNALSTLVKLSNNL